MRAGETMPAPSLMKTGLGQAFGGRSWSDTGALPRVNQQPNLEG
jgi:hypothetical protein